MEKRQIDELKPYLEKSIDFTWVSQNNTDYYGSEVVHTNRQLSQNTRDLTNIPDYLLWFIGNFFLFLMLDVIYIVLSARVREHKRNEDYIVILKISQRTLIMNVFTTIIGIIFLVTMLILLVNKSSTNF